MAKKTEPTMYGTKKEIAALPWNTQEYRDAQYSLRQPVSDHRGVSSAQQQAAMRTIGEAEAARMRRIMEVDRQERRANRPDKPDPVTPTPPVTKPTPGTVIPVTGGKSATYWGMPPERIAWEAERKAAAEQWKADTKAAMMAGLPRPPKPAIMGMNWEAKVMDDKATASLRAPPMAARPPVVNGVPTTYVGDTAPLVAQKPTYFTGQKFTIPNGNGTPLKSDKALATEKLTGLGSKAALGRDFNSITGGNYGKKPRTDGLF